MHLVLVKNVLKKVLHICHQTTLVYLAMCAMHEWKFSLQFKLSQLTWNVFDPRNVVSLCKFQGTLGHFGQLI